MFVDYRRKQREILARSPELTIRREYERSTAGTVALLSGLVSMVTAIVGTGAVRTVSLWLLPAVVVCMCGIVWFLPAATRRQVRPLVFWMRHFEASAGDAYRVQ